MRLVIESWNKKYDRLVPQIRRTALKLGRFLGVKEARVDVILVGDSFMEKNVLSFPAPKKFPGLHRAGVFLGEIYLNPGYIKGEGEKLDYMLAHGLLHILGYDHKKKNDIIRMEKKERQLMKLLGS